MFINSSLPMSQELVVVALGNLLKYLTDNHLKWGKVFLNLDKNPIITNVIVMILDSQVLLDETTSSSLNIFSNIHHPSGFKIQVRKDGLSLFNLLKNCSSSIGVQELKAIFSF
jgi:DNA mismatch repair ATPase MutS